jgi:antitoxin MazE
VQITEDSPVELTLVDGKLVLTPVRPVGRPRPPRKRLADLLAGITEENRHGEQDFGGPVGEEAL